MKPAVWSTLKWAALPTFGIAVAVLGGCGSRPEPVASTPFRMTEPTAVEAACSAPLFDMGRALPLSEFTNAGNMKLELREVHFRNVLARNGKDVEVAYRVEMRIQRSADGRALVPMHTLACQEENKPSAWATKLSRSMIPVVSDLHLPSTRITVYDQASLESELYNAPRISEITVSNRNYFSFNPNWAPYRQTRTLSQYMNLLRYRSLFQRVELREMTDGWIGIYAEKHIGGETAQLLILLGRAE